MRRRGTSWIARFAALVLSIAWLLNAPPASADTVHLSGHVGLDLGPGHGSGVWVVAAYAEDGSVAGFSYQPQGDYAIDLPPGTYDFGIPMDGFDSNPMVTTMFWVHDFEITGNVVHNFDFFTYQTTYHFEDAQGDPVAVDQMDNDCIRDRGFLRPGSQSNASDRVTTSAQESDSDAVVWRAAADDVSEPWVCNVRAYVGSDLYSVSVPASTGPDATVVLEHSPPPSDDDPDGVPDAVEAGAPNGGDGNHDGTADSQQPNVASLPANGADFAAGVPYLSVAAPEGTTLSDVSTLDPTTLANQPPAGTVLPAGLAAFKLNVANGATKTVSIYAGDTTGITGYAKYDPVSHAWSVLPSNLVQVYNPAGVVDDHVDVTLTDGGEGDADGLANGVISDPGGMAKLPVPTDSTPPVVTGAATKQPNAAGWYNQNVKVHWTATDPSGVVAPPADTVVSTEGANVTAESAQVCDLVTPTPNCGKGTLPGLRIDKTAPSLSVTGVSNGATYNLGAVPTVGCAASDALSGVAGACKGLLVGGNAHKVGQFAYGAAVSDKAGNPRLAAATYQVVYRFAGFAQPVNDPVATSGAPVSVFKAGSTVPLAFGLTNANGQGVKPVLVAPVKGAKTTASVNEAVVNGSGTSGSSYVWKSNRWQFDWSTKGLAAGYLYKVGVKLDDGTTHYVTVGLR